MNKKQFEKIKNKNIWLKLFILLIIIYLLIIFGIRIEKIKAENELLKENNKLISLIDILSKNCGNEFGSILITKEYGKEYYSIYKSDCNSKGYCKYVYIPIEECLK